MAAAADTGETLGAGHDLAPAQERAPQAARPRVGDLVRLAAPRSRLAGLLGPGDVGTVAEDDGCDCVPLMVKVGDEHDYYNPQDLLVCGRAPGFCEAPPAAARGGALGSTDRTEEDELDAM